MLGRKLMSNGGPVGSGTAYGSDDSLAYFARYGNFRNLGPNAATPINPAGGQRAALTVLGNPATRAGLYGLYQNLLNQGRVDPRLLASAQAQNSMSTQQQQTAARGQAARSGFGNSGVNSAIQAAIGSAGANRSANLNYQDIADSSQRNMQYLGLLNQLVQEPARDYEAMDLGQYNADRARKDARTNALIGAAGSAIGAFCKVAKEIYGEESDEYQDARHYVMAKVPFSVSLLYAQHGNELAKVARENPEQRERMRPIFAEFAKRGAKMREAHHADGD